MEEIFGDMLQKDFLKEYPMEKGKTFKMIHIVNDL